MAAYEAHAQEAAGAQLVVGEGGLLVGTVEVVGVLEEDVEVHERYIDWDEGAAIWLMVIYARDRNSTVPYHIL